MMPVNPYESPRELNGQRPRQSLLALPRVFPKYRVERQLVTIPLLIGLGLSGFDCLRGLFSDMYSFRTLSDDRVVTYFAPPHWDEAAWSCGILLAAACFVALLVLCASGIGDGLVRTATERRLAIFAVSVCLVPVLLNVLVGHRPLRAIYDGGYSQALAWTIGLYLFSGLFQIWYWWNRRQAVLGVFWAWRSYVVVCAWL